MPVRGKLIAIEGVDGSGKRTQAHLLANALHARGITGRPGTEDDYSPPVEGSMRSNNENYVIGLADRGIRSSVVRLPPLVLTHRQCEVKQFQFLAGAERR